MKQFSLEEFKKNPNRKVVTRDGKQVRILCTDANHNYPIVALIKYENGIENVIQFKKDGTRYSKESAIDLFFDTVKKEGWLNLHRNDMGFIMPGYLYDTEEQALKEIRDKEKHVATIKISWEE